MESRYSKKETNGVLQYMYTNDVYDFTINNDSGHLDANLEAKGNSANTVINQLTSDLADTTLKLETLVDVFSKCARSGMIPEEPTYIYGTPAESSKKHR